MPTATKSLAAEWGENLKAARIDAGLTQRQLAELIGASQYTISRLENGEHRPADGTKFALARAFGRSIDSLFPYRVPGAGELS